MRLIGSVLCALLITSAAQAGNWPQWRGPNHNGSTDETNLPTKWSRTENVVWSADLPGRAASTPVVWEDRVFVSSTDKANDSCVAMCLDRKSGKLLWKHTVVEGTERDYRSSFAAPSPATDGERVVFFYGTGDMVAYDLDGKELWTRSFGPFAFQWTFSTSPVFYDGRLYLQVCQRDNQVKPKEKPPILGSYLAALDPKTGETLWRHVRKNNAQKESKEAFSTPMPYDYEGRKQLIIAGGDVLTGHDAATGKELWRWGTYNIGHRRPDFRLVPSPVAGDGIVLICGPKATPVYAVDAASKGTLAQDDVAWSSKSEVTSDVPTPAFYDGDFFVLSDKKRNLSRIEPKTGKVKWTVETPGRTKFEASPLAADGKIYLINFDGQVTIFNAQHGDIINSIEMETERTKDLVRSSIVAANGQLFIRTNSKLYCVGK